MVELYIDGHKADLTTTVSVPMNYELEKLENPTIIKNNFSKTISLQATPNNNRIFGFYYELDKVHNGTGFNAIKRIPFELYRDSDLIETGYLQLNNIKYKGNTYTYEITLYGGLGDFLYSLAYDEEGNEKTLADLIYGVGENDEDFKFKINAETVNECWDGMVYGYDSFLGNTISFIPSYNGLYEDFDNNKVLINTNGQTTFSKSFTADGKTYSTINGYGMAELNKELTEWEIRDLRCYKQRPALRVKEFIKAICNPENNGGYEVELDGKYFFHRDNSYYEDTWIALPLLNPDSEDWVKTTTELATDKINDYAISIVSQDSQPVEITLTDYTSAELVDEFGGNSSIDIECDFSLKAYTDYYNGNPDLFLSYTYQEKRKNKFFWSGIGVWMEAIYNGVTVGISDCLVFTNGFSRGGERLLPTMSNFSANFTNNPVTNFYIVDGWFSWDNDGNYDYTFYDLENNGNTFKLKINNIPNFKGIEYRIKTKRWFGSNPVGMNEWVTPYMFTSTGGYVIMKSANMVGVETSAKINVNSNRKTLQNVTITKQQLLKNKITPASLLLSFTKLFGLYFVKDAKKKKVKILTKNSFFGNAEIIDIDNKVDYSSEVKIEPLMFNKKWYNLICPPLETTKMKDYKADYYEAEYGQKRINTNYNFNTDTEELYKDNQYQNVITLLDSSKYYKTVFSKNNTSEVAPTFSLDGCKYKLWQNSNIENSADKELKKADIMSVTKETVSFGPLVGQDCFSKICCFDVDDGQKSLNDLSVSLVFYNYDKYPQDNNGNTIWYTVSNDLPIMDTINEGTPMYLWTNSEYDMTNERICYRRSMLPQFTRYDLQGGNVYKSLDFGVPYETYITESYSEGATLYNRFWQRFYNDQFSENTRKVSAYVMFDDIELGNHSLSNFYYFNNCYWLLNKIVDYDIANPHKKVKCEFIKVNALTNYTDGQDLNMVVYEFQPEFDAIDDWDYTITGGEQYLTFGSELVGTFRSDYGIKALNIDIGDLSREEVDKRVKLVNDGNLYTLTITDIRGDVGLYISGFREIQSTINYSVNTTPPTAASSKTIQLAVGPDKKIVWANPVDDSDVMDIEMWDSNELYYRITPNAYGSSNRLSFTSTITIHFTDGTSSTMAGTTTTDSWNKLPQFDYWKTVDSIHIQVTRMSMIS